MELCENPDWGMEILLVLSGDVEQPVALIADDLGIDVSLVVNAAVRLRREGYGVIGHTTGLLRLTSSGEAKARAAAQQYWQQRYAERAMALAG